MIRQLIFIFFLDFAARNTNTNIAIKIIKKISWHYSSNIEVFLISIKDKQKYYFNNAKLFLEGVPKNSP